MVFICVMQYFSWHYRIGFIQSDSVKNKLMDAKYATFSESFWQNTILLDEDTKKQMADSQITEYYVGALYLLGNDIGNNGDATLLFLQEIEGEEADMIKLLNKLKGTKYYYSAGFGASSIDEWNSEIKQMIDNVPKS